MNCLFCEIIKGNIPSSKVYENEYVYAFRDINPQASVHILVVPKEHISSVDEITAENSALGAKIFEAIPEIAKAEKLDGDAPKKRRPNYHRRRKPKASEGSN